ncbi:MAG: rhomboid family intramembrane serine protease [Saprospiraceae bacterium]|mgnify:CR=1 FL=1|nr:rhomboid family intramembrane serine protease [Saprospiraceae bacterium]HMS67012.1 rhomboid family intramembrane serine protease [Saprospiraceae bacterium]
MMRITDVVKNLLILNVIIFFVVRFNLIPFIPGLENYFWMKPIGQGFEPYQIATHMFMHGGEQHLLFNMLMLFFIGPAVEQTLGPKRFLLLYIIAGVSSAFLHLLISNGKVVGASGAIYGILVAFATMFPNLKMMVFPIPFEIKAKYLVGAYVVYDLYTGLTGYDDNIAHFAHIGGAIAGFVMIYFWNMVKLR